MKDLALVKEHFDHMKVRGRASLDRAFWQRRWLLLIMAVRRAPTKANGQAIRLACRHGVDFHLQTPVKNSCPQVEKEKDALRLELTKAKSQISEADAAITAQTAELDRRVRLLSCYCGAGADAAGLLRRVPWTSALHCSTNPFQAALSNCNVCQGAEG